MTKQKKHEKYELLDKRNNTYKHVSGDYEIEFNDQKSSLEKINKALPMNLSGIIIHENGTIDLLFTGL